MSDAMYVMYENQRALTFSSISSCEVLRLSLCLKVLHANAYGGKLQHEYSIRVIVCYCCL